MRYFCRLAASGRPTPSQGIDEVPENYHIVTIDLEEKNEHTVVTLTQDNNADEKVEEHSEKNWKMMLASLKKLLEENSQVNQNL